MAQWVKGQSGNPGGKFKDKPLTDALRIEMASLGRSERIKHPKGSARSLAQAMLDGAAEGDHNKFNAIADRLEGKPVATVVTDSSPSLIREWLEWVSEPRVIEAVHQRLGKRRQPALERRQPVLDLEPDREAE